MKKAIRLTLAMVMAGGLALVIDHMAEYGLVGHWAWLDHGVIGLIMLVAGLVAALAIFRFKRGE